MSDNKKHLNIYLSNLLDNDDGIPVVNIQGEGESKIIETPDELPILPLKNTVLFPGVLLPISVSRNKSLKLIQDAYKGNRLIGTVSQKQLDVSDPSETDIHQVGTVAHILKVLRMPDNTTTVVIQGLKRFEITEFTSKKPYFRAKIKTKEDLLPNGQDEKFVALIESIREYTLSIIQLSYNAPPDIAFAIKNIENGKFLINFVSSNSDFKIPEKQKILEIDNLEEKAQLLLEYLSVEIKKLQVKDDIQSKAATEMNKQQREYFLNQQLKMIKDELGDNKVNKELEELKKKAKKKKWTKEVSETFHKELERLERLHTASPEYSNQLDYLQTLLELPWNEYSKDSFDLKRAENVLNDDHYGLDKVKDRILEHLAVLKLKGDMKSPIICLLGPPGVGKTSLGKSIAKALNRKYVRMSLGGLHDESEIRGHRKTYIGAMPGRIIQSLKKVKTSNPVFILDEIDKIGNDFRGDPSHALLEVLDPEQNNTFYDNYLELEYDLSKVMFVATANSLSPINAALRDRMEIINISGYILEEKIEIAKRHLINKQLENHGVKKTQLKFSNDVIERIIDDYTRESGVRQLDKKIAKVVRSIARKIGFEEEYKPNLSLDDLREILGPKEYIKGRYEGNKYAGVVTGLAWTAAGGDILMIESSLSRGNGRLTLTGNLGEVMKESAMISLEYVKAHAESLNIDPTYFNNWNLHIHVPEGAIPKDGPSAGITMTTSIVSAFTQRKVKPNLAMTGETTLRGRVLPVGGIKEKILAAKRAGIKELILCKDNEKDVSQINELYISGLQFHYVEDVLEVINFALLDEKVDNPKTLELQQAIPSTDDAKDLKEK